MTLLLATSLKAADFELQDRYTANGCGRVVQQCCNVCVMDRTNLTLCTPSVAKAMHIMMHKSCVVGQKIALLVFTPSCGVIEMHSPGFNPCDPCFQKMKSRILSCPESYSCLFFRFLSKQKCCLGTGIFIAPYRNGPCDPNNQLRMYAEEDGSL